MKIKGVQLSASMRMGCPYSSIKVIKKGNNEFVAKGCGKTKRYISTCENTADGLSCSNREK